MRISEFSMIFEMMMMMILLQAHDHKLYYSKHSFHLESHFNYMVMQILFNKDHGIFGTGSITCKTKNFSADI